MNIAMFSNVYLPLVGGVQRSIATFKREFEKRGHRVLVVTPSVEEGSLEDPTVVEVPAIQNFNGSQFSVALPIPGYLAPTLDEFAPDVVHSHHPFLLGDTALRTAVRHACPLVFTYHTMWEHYLHYTQSDSPAMQAFVKRMASEYCGLCDQVIAPCESTAEILRERGVTTPITVIPTGIDTDRFRHGDGPAARRRFAIPEGAFVAGYVGRLGAEKNLELVAEALSKLCARRDDAHTLIVGDGESGPRIQRIFREAALEDRLHMPGILQDQALIDAYHALDVFTFASKTDTQGLVLAEAMVAGCPVVALDATGARDIVEDGRNGRLLMSEEPDTFARAVLDLAELSGDEFEAMRQAAIATGLGLSGPNCAARVLALYDRMLQENGTADAERENEWSRALRRLEAEWNLWSGRAAAAAEAAMQGYESEE